MQKVYRNGYQLIAYSKNYLDQVHTTTFYKLEGSSEKGLYVCVASSGHSDIYVPIEDFDKDQFLCKMFGKSLEDLSFITHGTYRRYEIQLSDCGYLARVKCAGKISGWLEIEHVLGQVNCIDDQPDMEAVIDPNGYNIPLCMVMKVN